MAVRAVAHRSLFWPLLAAMLALAWAMLFLWQQSPYALFLDHHLTRELCHHDCALEELGLYIAAWTLMTAAMMLPTTFPLIEMFRRLTLGRKDQTLLMALLVAGYLAVWMAFAVVAHEAGDLVLVAYERLDPLGQNVWAINAGILGLAGAFQFSALKHRCLDKCRTPLSFVLRYWREQGGRWGAFMLGVRHGVFCVGCCWALMLLMFGVAAGSVGWMLALGAVMAIEKNLPWGHRLSPVLGAALIAWGGAIALERLAA